MKKVPKFLNIIALFSLILINNFIKKKCLGLPFMLFYFKILYITIKNNYINVKYSNFLEFN